MSRVLLLSLFGFLITSFTMASESNYLKDITIQLPGISSSVTVVVPEEANEIDFMAPIEASLKHANSTNGVNERVARETIAYSLAGAFEMALKEKNSVSAVNYAIAAILNGAHKIDDSFLYTLDDTNPYLIDSIVQEQEIKKDKWDQKKEVWNTTKKTIDALISFQTPNPNRYIDNIH